MSNQRSAISTRSGFTITELLIVIGIIVILAGILMATMGKAFKAADKTRLTFQLQTIEQGLEAYKTDFNGYPVTSIANALKPGEIVINAAGFRGMRTLCKALYGATPQGTLLAGPVRPDDTKGDQDGADGLGFRVPPRSGVWKSSNATTLEGKVYGPYLTTSQLKIAKMHLVDAGDSKVGDLDLKASDYDDSTVILDANNRPILYYPVLNPAPRMVITTPATDAPVLGAGGPNAVPPAPLPMYRFTDNDFSVGAARDASRSGLAEGDFRKAMGDTNGNGSFEAGEQLAVRGKYILWSAGPDGLFGPNANAKPPGSSDDVTNFND